MSTWIILGAAPRNHRHNSVMVQMQESYLPILLAQHKEHSVQQLRHFRQEIYVAASRFLQGQLFARQTFCMNCQNSPASLRANRMCRPADSASCNVSARQLQEPANSIEWISFYNT